MAIINQHDWSGVQTKQPYSKYFDFVTFPTDEVFVPKGWIESHTALELCEAVVRGDWHDPKDRRDPKGSQAAQTIQD